MPENPLRQPEERLSFCDAYFHAVGGEPSYERAMYREYVLPTDVDKELTDRPFFWMWAEKTNQKVEPTTLRLAFTEEAKLREDERLRVMHERQMEENPPQTRYEAMFRRSPQTELMDLGCFRIGKILDSARRRGFFASVVPKNSTDTERLIPWLMINGMIRYQADSLQEEWFSVGTCLENLQVVPDFFSRIHKIPMRMHKPPFILRQASHTLDDAVACCKQWITGLIDERDHTWAMESAERLADNLSQLDAYYMSMQTAKTEEEQSAWATEHVRKGKELAEKSTPHIYIQPTQVALVGLPLR